MRRTTNQWQAVIALLRRWADRGIMEPGQWSELEEALEAFEHARKTKDWKKQDRALGRIARVFLKESDSER
ncbi:MAG: hypothetical protein K8J08_04940 [Thermoanaerobaculia bacterium]|nr:hypothetical protein [Thermoanaerobaculia bacterium]